MIRLKYNIKVLFFYSTFLCVNLIYAKENNKTNMEIKYFADTTGIYGGIEGNVPIFSNELDKNLYPLKDTSFFSYINGLTTRVSTDSEKGVKLDIPLEFFYKVYYENNIQRKADLIKLSGYAYVDGVLHIDKNATKINEGVAVKFDNKGRGIYRYSFETGESCRTFYAIQYEEIICTSNKEVSPIKNYYEDNQLRIAMYYQNSEFLYYATLKGAYSKSGQKIDSGLDHMKKLYVKNYAQFDEAKKKQFKSMIKERERKLKDMPDLNLSLEKAYMDKIDKLNGRGGVK